VQHSAKPRRPLTGGRRGGSEMEIEGGAGGGRVVPVANGGYAARDAEGAARVGGSSCETATRGWRVCSAGGDRPHANLNSASATKDRQQNRAPEYKNGQRREQLQRLRPH
jgi:hypothetical protein